MIKKLHLFGLLFFVIEIFSAKAQSTPDPGLPGSYAVSSQEYNFGDLAWTDPSFPVPMEIRGSVHYPTTLSAGPFPVLMFMHGRHESTFQTSNPSNTTGNWPPAPGYQSITSFQGYDYLATQMASHGYIVISISTNAINADDNSTGDYGMSARAALMQHHLDLWNTWNTVGAAPFGTTFVGTLDMNNIGTMGHSRGGEGVVAQALLNRSLGSPYGIKAVLTLAPVDFHREVLNGIPMLNVAPYCDGDVSDLQGVHYYDNARYSDLADETAKHTVLFMGANHNFFNTVWTPGLYPAGGADDWDDYVSPGAAYCGSASSSSKRLTPTRQQAAINAYLSAFFRVYIGGETAFAPILNVDDIVPPASSTLDSSSVFVSYHAPASQRMDINRMETVSTATTNTLTGSVTINGLVSSGICGGGLGEAACGVSSAGDKEPHKGSSSQLGLSQMGMRWDGPTDYYQNSIPVANENFTTYMDLQFRTSENYAQTASGTDLNFTIQLTDAIGNTSSKMVTNYTHALFFQPGTFPSELPKLLFNTVKIPLADFTGIDLTQVQKIKFLFDKSAAGSIYVTDIALSGLTPLPTSIGTNHSDNILIYPNPTNGDVTINFGNEFKHINKLNVFDIQGNLVYQLENVSGEILKLDLSNYSKGIYILNIVSEKEAKNYKIVKQ